VAGSGERVAQARRDDETLRLPPEIAAFPDRALNRDLYLWLAALAASLMRRRILVVDDIPANVKLLEARLSAEYFDVITALSGAEALTICERAQCDIVLLDVMMPDMDGFEVCRRLKSRGVAVVPGADVSDW